MTTPIPANPAADISITRETRIPLGGGRQKLAVPQRPGYHRHWFINRPERIAQALQAGYAFAKKGDVAVPNHSLAGDRTKTLGTDLGSQVSVIAGGEESFGGQPARLVLMEIPDEWRNDDIKAREAQNDRLVAALRRGDADGPGSPGSLDKSHRVVGSSNRNIFTKRT